MVCVTQFSWIDLLNGLHGFTYVYASKSLLLMASISCSVILIISWRRATITIYDPLDKQVHQHQKNQKIWLIWYDGDKMAGI